MRRLFHAAALTLFGALPAYAQVGLPWPGPGGVAGAAAGYQGVGDSLSGAIAAYGLRAYNAAAAASQLKALKLTSTHLGGETCDIKLGTDGFVGGTGSVTASCSGADNGVSLSTFCNSNSDCTVANIYDQSGNALDLNPVTFLNVLSISPLKVVCANNGYFSTSGTVTVAQPIAEASVAQRTTVVSYAVVADVDDANDTGFYNTSGNALLYAGTLTSATYSEGTQVSLIGTLQGAGSILAINNTQTTLNPGTGGGASKISICADPTGGSPFLGNWWETTFWQGTAANSANFPFSAVTSNQRDATNGWNF